LNNLKIASTIKIEYNSKATQLFSKSSYYYDFWRIMWH